MEKPDRDFTHAKRAEEEYKQLIQQFPDSKLVPEGKQRLREVQEVLAEREFRIGRFYYLRESWAAAIARLKSLSDAYPLYSGADDALFMLGQSNEHLAERAHVMKDEAARAKEVKHFDDEAAAAYSTILTRYPLMDRAKDARARLEALHRPIPKATPEAIAQNKQEEASRREMGHFSRLMFNFHRRPDVSQASKVGEPTLVAPKETNATDVSREAQRVLLGGAGSSTVNAEIAPSGAAAPAPNQPVPRSPAGTSAGGNAGAPDNSIPELAPTTEAQPTTQAPPTAPAQVNEAASEPPASGSSSNSSSQQAGSSSTTQGSNDAQSSSKGKKKRKLWPF
jgi:outer membrane protein assembly factor BamD